MLQLTPQMRLLLILPAVTWNFNNLGRLLSPSSLLGGPGGHRKVFGARVWDRLLRGAGHLQRAAAIPLHNPQGELLGIVAVRWMTASPVTASRRFRQIASPVQFPPCRGSRKVR